MKAFFNFGLFRRKPKKVDAEIDVVQESLRSLMGDSTK
jgi:hypothetical protein